MLGSKGPPLASWLHAGGVLAVGADAAGARLHLGRHALEQHDGLLDVRPPHAVGLSVRVTDVVPEGHRLVTNIASASHDDALSFRCSPAPTNGRVHAAR